MEDKDSLVEPLLKRAAEYAKTSYELVKLKAFDKTSDVVSSLISHSVAIVMLFLFILFLSLGLAFWLGEILGKTFYGFFVIAGFYGIVWLILHFLMRKWLKKRIWNNIIKMVFK